MKTNKIIKLLAIVMVFCLTACCFVGCGEKTDTESQVSSDNGLLYGNAVDYDDGDDGDVSDSSDNGLINNSGSTTGGNGGGSGSANTGSGVGSSSGIETNVSSKIEIDEQGKKDFLSTVPKSLKGTTVKVLTWWTPLDYEKAKAEAFEKATGIKIKWITTGGNDAYYTKLSAMIGQDNAPDLACIKQNNFPSAVIQNYFEPLDKGNLNLKDSQYDINVMNTYKWNNKYYGAVIKGSSNINLYTLIFNKKMFKDNGIQNPYDLWQAGKWNWDTLCDTATKIKNAAKLETAIVGDYSGAFFTLSSGSDAIKFNNGKIVNNTKDTVYRNAWKYFRNMIFDKKIMSKSGNNSMFTSSKAAMYLTGNYVMQKGGYLEKSVKFDWGFAPIPSPKGSKLTVPAQLQLWGFARGAKNIEAASYWLQYWQNPNYDTSGHEMWCTDSAASFNNWLWEQNKQFENYIGIVQYGGNYKYDTYYGALLNESADVDTTLDQWSSTMDSNIKKMVG